MIYYQDDEITVRTREERDAQIIADEQIRQGWHSSPEWFLKELRDHEEGKCVSLTAEYRGEELLAECDPAHSFCIAEEDGSYSGCILTKKLEEDLFQILLLYNTGGVMQAIVLLKAFLADGMSITFVEANSHVKSLAESLEKGREKKLQKKQLKIAVKRICE